MNCTGSGDCECVDMESDSSREEIKDILSVMREQESTVYRRLDYLAKAEYQTIVDRSWRQRIVEWMFSVVDHCSLRRDSIAIAAYYVDLCLQKGMIETREEFQLAAMTGLQLAIKLYDSTVVKLDSMIKLGRGLFTEQDVINMESKMLKTLGWQVHPPTPVCFLRQYLRLLPASIAPLTRYLIGEVTRFISEISVCLYKFVKYPASVVAYAGMLIAMERIDEDALPNWQRQQIFDIMLQAANLQNGSSEVMEAVTHLQVSLEQNVSLQDLMATIGAQCTDGYSKLEASTYTTPSGPVQNQSPRDVVSRRQ